MQWRESQFIQDIYSGGSCFIALKTKLILIPNAKETEVFVLTRCACILF